MPSASITIIGVLGPTNLSNFIELRHQYIKKIIKKNAISVNHTPSEELANYMITKPLYSTG